MASATTTGLSAPQIIEHVTYACDYTPFDVKWVPASAKVVIVGSYARGSGVIDVRELDTAALTSVRKAEKKDGFKCCTFGATTYEKRHLATGDYAGHVQTWDLERLDAPIFSVKGHSSIVNAIDGCGGLNIGGGAPEIVTGSRDGSVKVWDVRQTDPVASLEPAPGQTARDCWAVGFGNSFNDQDRVVCAGYDNGDVKLMCLRTNRLLWETNVNNGVVGVQFDRKDIQMNKMVVTTLESKFRVYDMRTFHPQEGYAHLVQQAHKSTVWLAKHLPQNRDLFMTTGGNGSLHLYQYHYPDQRAVKDENGVERGVMGSVRQLATSPISTQPIVGFDWHAENIGLACMASLDQNVRIAIVTKLAGR